MAILVEARQQQNQQQQQQRCVLLGGGVPVVAELFLRVIKQLLLYATVLPERLALPPSPAEERRVEAGRRVEELRPHFSGLTAARR